MKLNKYPDGTSYVSETKLGEQVFRVNTYEQLWQLGQFVDAFNNQWNSNTNVVIKPNIIIPNLIDAQADRRFNTGESSGLKLVCKYLNSLEANFKIFHPHNSEVVEALMDNVEIIDNTEFIKKVFKEIRTETFSQDTILFSSDAGGFKPLMKLADKLKWQGGIYGASKSRKYEDGKSKLVQVVDKQDFEGKDILIIDDMCLYGGTFIGLAKMLRERNCGRLYLAVSHMTLPKPAPELFDVFDIIFTTDSKGISYLTPGKGHYRTYGEFPKNLKVVKLFS